jgi:S1-C subfamily serine protease
MRRPPVPGDVLDILLVAAALLFAVSGYRQGFVVGVLSFVGFLGGGIIGAKAAPDVAGTGVFADVPAPVVGLGVVFLAAILGQLVATVVGAAVRDRLTWHPARTLDAVGGAVVSVVSLLLVAWLIGTAVASSPFPTLASAVRNSAVLRVVDGLVPAQGQQFFASFRRLIDDRGFPEVFGGLAPTQVQEVPPPDDALTQSPVVQAARPSVLKVTGVAESCRRSIEGTGFVYAPQRVLTNAHVVAGVDEPRVQVGDEELAAQVVVFDPGRDLAVLAVPGLERTALAFDGEAESGAGAIIVGYPQNGPFRAEAARIRGTQRARGPDIYGQETVVREIYALRGLVQPGNSGGPLLNPEGEVYGVIFAAAADDPQTGYALSNDEVRPVAEAGVSATEPVDTRTCD